MLPHILPLPNLLFEIRMLMPKRQHLLLLSLTFVTGQDRLFLMVARVVKHVIDENSPLTTLTTTNDMASHKRWEIIVVLEGTVLETGSAY